MIGPKRLRAYARPRQVAMYLCKQLTNRSLPEIGRRFGERDHTTVMHGVRQIEELMATDSQLADDVELLRRIAGSLTAESAHLHPRRDATSSGLSGRRNPVGFRSRPAGRGGHARGPERQ